MYPSPYIRFKSPRQEREWFARSSGAEIHPALYAVVLTAARWYYQRTGRPAVLTHLLRTEGEQRRIYPDRAGYRSPHEFGRAVDMRTAGLEPSVAGEWEDWINRTFPYSGKAGANTALLHQVGGLGKHLHIQIGPLEIAPKTPETFIQQT